MNMLAIAGFVLIIIFMYLIMTKRLSAMTALVIIPMAFGVTLGFAPKLGTMALDGIRKVAPIGIMIGFALLYFGTMIDVGMFDPIIRFIQKATKGDPVRIIVGTSVLATLVSLDGDGATTYMVTCSAMLALHRRLGLNPLILPTVALLPASVINLTPWGGPTGRVISVMQLETSDIFIPLIPAMVVAILYIWLAAYYFGLKERRRTGYRGDSFTETELAITLMGEDEDLKRPRLLWFNLSLTLLLMIALCAEILPLAVLFMIAAAIALIVNYPDVGEQQRRIAAHAPNALPVMGMIFAAGIFTGILSGTKMLDAMSVSLISLIPDTMGPHLALITSLISLPAVYFLTNDAFYFGILPVLVKAAANYGISPASMGIAALVGQGAHYLSPLVASTYVLVGMSGVDYGDFQKFCLPWAIGSSLLMIAVMMVLGYIPL